ncbi:MFS transporter [Eisenibacter elegans]|uniref:MFS transporter n=1 Tax=Eisenibacter elegans TaxID=997 RepID=UPI0003FABD76|nr:MFS transporter [Eisenibacter elegans]
MIAKRWQISLVLLVSVIIAFFDRLNVTYIISELAQQYGWSDAELGSKGGLLMTIFYVAYGISNIFLGGLVGRYGARRSLLVIVVLWSAATAVGALLHTHFAGLLLSRILLGLSEGLHYPAMTALTKVWFPVSERSRANGLWTSGIFFALVLGPLVLVPVMQAFGWRFMFYFLAILGMGITWPLVYFFVYDQPETHPHISAKERHWIAQAIAESEESQDESPLDVRALLRQHLFWVVVVIGMLSNTIAHGLLNWLPTYFIKERQIAEQLLSRALAIPYVFSIAGVLFWAYLGDLTRRRLLICALGFVLAGIFAAFALRAHDIPTTVAVLSAAIFSVSAFITTEYTLVQRILPKQGVARGIGLYNGLAIIVGGGGGPAIVGAVVNASGSLTAGLFVLVGFCFAVTLVLLYLNRLLRF